MIRRRKDVNPEKNITPQQNHVSGTGNDRRQPVPNASIPPRRRVAVAKGPRRIADPRDVKEFKKSTRPKTDHPQRRISMQHPAPTSAELNGDRNQQRTRRRSAPARPAAFRIEDFADNDLELLERERMKLEHLKLANDLLNSPSLKNKVQQLDVNDFHHKDKSKSKSAGRKVSFGPVVHEIFLSPVREEAEAD